MEQRTLAGDIDDRSDTECTSALRLHRYTGESASTFAKRHRRALYARDRRRAARRALDALRNENELLRGGHAPSQNNEIAALRSERDALRAELDALRSSNAHLNASYCELVGQLLR